MRTTLNSRILLPITEPYTDLGYINISHAGAFINPMLPNKIVDWVLVELRHQSDPSTVTTAKAFLLRNNSQVVSLDGIGKTLVFDNVILGARYHVAIHHRNHLGVLTGSATILAPTLLPEVDFTDLSLAVYGGGFNAQILAAIYHFGAINPEGMFAMVACDATGDGMINVSDDTQITVNTGSLLGYRLSDCNMNGLVQNSDRQSFYLKNAGRVEQFQ